MKIVQNTFPYCIDGHIRPVGNFEIGTFKFGKFKLNFKTNLGEVQSTVLRK